MIEPRKTAAAILLAGGRGARMGGVEKPFLKIKEREIIDYSFEIFSSIEEVIEIAIVAPEHRHSTLEARFQQKRVKVSLAPPGERRQDSVYNGLQALESESDIVLIHDAARPLVSRRAAIEVLEAAIKHGAALAAVPVRNTIKITDEALFSIETPPRHLLWEAHTPQAMERSLLIEAFRNSIGSQGDVWDDAEMAEKLGHRPAIVRDSYTNIKITTPEDIPLAEAMLSQRSTDHG